MTTDLSRLAVYSLVCVLTILTATLVAVGVNVAFPTFSFVAGVGLVVLALAAPGFFFLAHMHQQIIMQGKGESDYYDLG